MGADPEGSVELAGAVFPGDRCGQLDDLVVGEVLLDLCEELVTDVLIGDRDSIGVLQGGPFSVVKQRTRFVVRNVENLLGGYAQLATHGSVDVLSEDAAIERCDSPIDQRREFTFE